MKRLLMLCFVAVCCCANQEEYFLQGNKLYDEGAFDKALESYQKIDRKGPAVLYNMGNCFYRLGNYSSAIVHWRRADTLGPWSVHSKVDRNCALAYKQLGKDYSRDTVHTLSCWFMRVINIISLLWWQLLFLFVWIVAILAMSQAVIQGKYWRISGLIFLMCSITFCFVVRYRSTVGSYALIIDNEATVRTGPADEYGIVATVQCLDEFDIDEQNDKWLKVHNACVAGWVPVYAVAIIDVNNGLSGGQKG